MMASGRTILLMQIVAGVLLGAFVLFAAARPPVLQRAVAEVSTATAAPPTASPVPTLDLPSPTATAQPTATATPEPTATMRPTATPSPSPEPTPALQAAREMDYVPILMYHYVRTVDPNEDELGYNLSVSPERFEEHLIWLRDNDFTAIRMDHLADCLRGLQRCPQKSVVLTFDDGYADAASAALPLLEEYDATATFYIVTGFVGKPGYLTWNEVRQLHDSGMEIGSHSLNHPDLAARDPEVAREEIEQSRKILSRKIGVPVRSFSYPIGSYTPEVAELVREAGYTNAVTTYPGSSLQLMFELPRRRILGGESVEALAWYVTEPDFE